MCFRLDFYFIVLVIVYLVDLVRIGMLIKLMLRMLSVNNMKVKFLVRGCSVVVVFVVVLIWVMLLVWSVIVVVRMMK